MWRGWAGELPVLMAVLALVGHDAQAVLMGDSAWLPFAEALRTRRVNLAYSHRTLARTVANGFTEISWAKPVLMVVVISDWLNRQPQSAKIVEMIH